jgi:hypothetical protein
VENFLIVLETNVKGVAKKEVFERPLKKIMKNIGIRKKKSQCHKNNKPDSQNN